MKTLILLALLTASYLPESAPEPVGVLGEESVKERLQWYLGRYN